MLNKVILIGNVGKDPEVQTMQDGETKVAKFSLATSESYKNKSGERVTNTEWHNIVAWRGLAKVIESYIKKGSQIYIEGKLTNRSYEKDGQTRYFTEIVASEMKMLGTKGDSEQSTGQSNTPPPHAGQQAPEFAGDMEDDLPF